MGLAAEHIMQANNALSHRPRTVLQLHTKELQGHSPVVWLSEHSHRLLPVKSQLQESKRTHITHTALHIWLLHIMRLSSAA